MRLGINCVCPGYSVSAASLAARLNTAATSALDALAIRNFITQDLINTFLRGQKLQHNTTCDFKSPETDPGLLVGPSGRI